MMKARKLRVWWIPQIGTETFYVPVESVEEGKKIMDLLAAYDLFQLQNDIKPDFSNVGGIEVFEDNEWCDWHFETEDDYFEDVDEYCESDACERRDELERFQVALFEQIDYEEIERRNSF